MKRILCFFLCFLMLLTTIYIKPGKKVFAESAPTNAYSFYYDKNYADHIGYFNNGKIYFVARAKTAGSKIRFRTVGFQITVTINNRTYYCRFKLGGTYIRSAGSKIVGERTYTMWYMNYNLKSANFISYLKKHFPSHKEDFSKVSTKYDTYLQFDSIITINQRGKIKGGMDDSGNLNGEVYLTDKGIPKFNTSGVKKANSSWRFTSNSDDSKGGISRARPWADPNFTDYFQIPLTIPHTKVPEKKTIKIYFKDYKTHKNIIPYEKFKTVTITDSITVKVKYRKLTGYTLVKSAFRYDGKKYVSVKNSSVKTRKISVSKSHKTEHVVFFYKNDVDPPQTGTIVFNPYRTHDWTNAGKAAEGKGLYPVTVMYAGKLPIESVGTVKVKHTEKDSKGKDKVTHFTINVNLKWDINKIKVDGDAKATIDGKVGSVYIDKEGKDLELHAKAILDEKPTPVYPAVAAGEEIEKSTLSYKKPSDQPEGKSGQYNLDWTKPNIKITPSADNKWHNDNPYNINLQVNDPLSGIDQKNSTVTVTDSSHYNNKIFDAPEDDGDNSDGDEGDIDQSDDGSEDTGSDVTEDNNDDQTDNDGDGYNNDENKTDTEYLDDNFDEDISLDQDGMYKFDVNAVDEATNKNTKKQKTYLVDSTQPDVYFNIKPGIFSESNGAVRKESKKGSDFAFYGTLTFADNLSGVTSLAYNWSYGTSNSADDYDSKDDSDDNSNENNGKYETIYTSPYTTKDRYGEIKRDDNDSITGTDGEIHTADIEKPVGDNLYLNVKELDTAGNETDTSFGPFDDPIKMKDFEVTDIRDPLWDSVFWKDSNYTQPTGVTYKASQLPIDKDSHPSIKNAAPKLGYSFYFSITTEFLYREQDRIEIEPTFFYWDGKKRVPADVYYNSNNNELTKLGSSQDLQKINLNTSRYGDVLIGNLSDLTLTKGVRICKGREWTNGWKGDIQYTDGKIQWWYGRYFLPATSVFVKQGDEPNSQNFLREKNIIVNFDIIAYKNGIETLSSDQQYYYSPDQWKVEGGPKSSEYEPGDVMVYDNKHTVLSDFRSFIVQ